MPTHHSPPPATIACGKNNLILPINTKTTKANQTNTEKQPIMTLNERLYQIRKHYGLTQADIAYRLEVSPQAYSEMERTAEHIKYQNLVRIASVLQVPVSFLVDVEHPVYVYEP